MELEKFKFKKNKIRPDFCYSYEMTTKKRKYSIFTMNDGKSFLASIEELRLDGRWYQEFSENKNSINECLEAFDKFVLN